MRIFYIKSSKLRKANTLFSKFFVMLHCYNQKSVEITLKLAWLDYKQPQYKLHTQTQTTPNSSRVKMYKKVFTNAKWFFIHIHSYQTMNSKLMWCMEELLIKKWGTNCSWMVLLKSHNFWQNQVKYAINDNLILLKIEVFQQNDVMNNLFSTF